MTMAQTAEHSSDHTDATDGAQEKKKPKPRLRSLADIRNANGFVGKFIQMVRETWLDWLTLCALGGLTAGVRRLSFL